MWRVGALFLTANAGARPLGAAMGAIIGTAVMAGVDTGPAITACLVVAALGYVLQFVVILFSSVRRLQVLPPSADEG